MDNSWLVVGLGNPGPTYAGHRHNVGQMVVDLLASRLAVRWRTRGRCEVAEGRLGVPPDARRIVLAKPRSYMNLSGDPVGSLAAFYKLPPVHLVVVHDELDIPYDTLRLKLGGGDNGHNGLRSIRQALGTGDFHRVRVGVGRPPGRQDPAAFVLSPFSAAERKDLPLVLDRAADAVEELVTEGLVRAQNSFHA